MPDAVMVTSSFLPGHGGIESYLAELCSALAPRVAVLAPASRDGKPLPTDVPYETVPLPGAPLPGPRTLHAIERAARRRATDRIVFGTPWPLATLGPALRRRGLRYAVIVHGAELLVPSAIPGLRAHLARSLADASLLLPVSDFTAARVRALVGPYGEPPVERLHARVDTARFSPDVDPFWVRAHVGLPDDARVLLCFGRLVRRKGVDRLVRALPDIARRVPGVALVVGGTGPDRRRLQTIARRMHAPVVFAGRVPDADAAAYYAAADVFALPVADRWGGLEIEGLGVALLEAAACGTPCVTGRSGGTPEAVVDGVTGFVIDATDRARLVEAIASLLMDDDLATSMARAGRKHVESEFSVARPPHALIDWLSAPGVR